MVDVSLILEGLTQVKRDISGISESWEYEKKNLFERLANAEGLLQAVTEETGGEAEFPYQDMLADIRKEMTISMDEAMKKAAEFNVVITDDIAAWQQMVMEKEQESTTATTTATEPAPTV